MTLCEHCWEPIVPAAEWPMNGVHGDGVDFHDGCLDEYRREDAQRFRAQVEVLPLLRAGRENATQARVTGRPVPSCNCETAAGEEWCPVHDGRWAS